MVVTSLVAALLAGCARGPILSAPPWQTQNAWYDNPVLLPVADHEFVWETVADVVSDYFRIEREEPVRLVGNVLTEGELDTYPTVGSTLLEPWRGDSANGRERLESTLQSIRRKAVVRVVPDEHGFWVDVAVYKELESVVQPDHATAGAATFRNDSSLTRVGSPDLEEETNDGWIPKGRDTALEQRIVEQLLARISGSPSRPFR